LRPFPKPPLYPIRFDVGEFLFVHSGCALVGFAAGVGVRQDVRTIDLVVQEIEAEAGFGLRFRM
jgi:hypothetical protein